MKTDAERLRPFPSSDDIAEMIRVQTEESDSLDFKETLILSKPVADKEHDPRRDIVRDVAAFANGVGGTIIVGVSERGNTKHAAGWGYLEGDAAAQIGQTVAGLCRAHIDPLIVGLVVRIDAVEQTALVVISIPKDCRLHSVRFDGAPEYWIRPDDTKRPMTHFEIQAGFAQAGNRSDMPKQADGLPNGQSAVKEALQHAQAEIAGLPFFFIAGAPVALHADALDLQSQELQQILAKNPDENSPGTILGEIVSRVKMISRDISVSIGSHTFSLRGDGLMTWTVRVSDGASFFQSEKEDRKRVFNPYTVVGYPLSFARLFCTLRGIMKGTSGPYVMQMAYSGCQDIALYPRRIGLERYSSRPLSEDLDKGHTAEQLIRAPYEPEEFSWLVPADQITHDLLKHFYQAFGYPQEKIPFWDDTAKVFDLDPEQHR